MDKLIMWLLIGIVVLFLGLVVMVIVLIVRAKKHRDFIFMILPTQDIALIKGRYFNKKSFDLEVDGVGQTYIVDDTCIFRVGKKGRGCYYKLNIPAPIKQGLKGNKDLEWRYISSENIFEICNTKHVSVVAKAGENTSLGKDILMFILLGFLILLNIIMALKIFGVIKSKAVGG